mgnify:CR=1 FL=1
MNNIIEILEERLKGIEAIFPQVNDGSVVSEYEHEELTGRISELKYVIDLLKSGK